MPIGAPHLVQPGSQGDNASLDISGAALESPWLPDLAALGLYGRAFSASQAIAGVAPGTSGTTTTPAFTVYNATKPIYLIDLTVVYVSGTIGAGSISFARQIMAAAPTGGTAITAYALNGAGTTNTLCGTGHTVTAIAAAADRYPLLDLGATLATAAAAGVGAWAGVYRVPINAWLAATEVGMIYGITAAGSSPLVRMSVRFADDPRVTALAAAA
jgi:hypothetical protein